MATMTPTTQLMPVGTILRAGDKYYEVVRATAKTIWAQELETDTFRGVGGIWHTLPVLVRQPPGLPLRGWSPESARMRAMMLLAPDEQTP